MGSGKLHARQLHAQHSRSAGAAQQPTRFGGQQQHEGGVLWCVEGVHHTLRALGRAEDEKKSAALESAAEARMTELEQTSMAMARIGTGLPALLVYRKQPSAISSGHQQRLRQANLAHLPLAGVQVSGEGQCDPPVLLANLCGAVRRRMVESGTFAEVLAALFDQMDQHNKCRIPAHLVAQRQALGVVADQHHLRYGCAVAKGRR